jgi:SOS-response transcriptional repressor LexA
MQEINTKYRGHEGLKRFLEENCSGELCAREIDGNNLLPCGIQSGDFVICKPATRYIPGSFAVWETPDGITAKYAEFSGNGRATLCNDRGRQSFKTGDVKLLEIIVGVDREEEVSQ